MLNDPEPEPYLVLMDQDPGGPKTCGSGSTTLLLPILIMLIFYSSHALLYDKQNIIGREAGARFINLDVSVLTDKWYGESQKIAGAVFTLASKIQPCIIFIDEIGNTQHKVLRRD